MVDNEFITKRNTIRFFLKVVNLDVYRRCSRYSMSSAESKESMSTFAMAPWNVFSFRIKKFEENITWRIWRIDSSND